MLPMPALDSALQRLSNIETADLPLYPLSAVARYLAVRPTTLENWVRGRGTSYFLRQPLIVRPESPLGYLSFRNLAQAYTIQALLSERYQVKMSHIRTAVATSPDRDRVLLDQDLRATFRGLFLDRADDVLLNIGEGRQGAFDFVAPYLERIVRDSGGGPALLFPLTSGDAPERNAKHVRMSPVVAHGEPKLRLVVDRVLAGETKLGIARDFGLKVVEIEEAIRYESFQAAAAA
jgi:hypothetical protein